MPVNSKTGIKAIIRTTAARGCEHWLGIPSIGEVAGGGSGLSFLITNFPSRLLSQNESRKISSAVFIITNFASSAGQAPANLVGYCPPCPLRGAAVASTFPKLCFLVPMAVSQTLGLRQTSELLEKLPAPIISRPQHGDLKLLGTLSGQGTDGGARTRDTRVPTDLKADSLPTVPQTFLKKRDLKLQLA
ncbi:hypothetical protein PoB_006019300 [Plakobranchus ocellatus]|uniref:Uncharacterized protein n=1 Tax=Plakobranchus ocellatus TaxID=259542 RepID=A0AAV4CP75_9GAST|nr:hypothetical protein PoB_006019300 [Plakobranchus ocellatus]